MASANQIPITSLILSLILLSFPALSQEQIAAPDFSLVDTGGKEHNLADYRGEVLVVNFWATWCAPCVKEMPSLNRAWALLKDEKVRMFALNMGETSADIERFTQKTPIDFPVLLDENMEQGPLWSLRGLPTTYIVDKSGQIVATEIGDREWDDAEWLERIRQLAQAKY